MKIFNKQIILFSIIKVVGATYKRRQNITDFFPFKKKFSVARTILITCLINYYLIKYFVIFLLPVVEQVC